MFSKLVKHEWKYYQKIFLIMLISIIGFTLILSIYITFLNFDNFLDPDSFMDILPRLSMYSLGFVYYFTVIAIMLISNFVIASRYYKSMYTDQGYLTHTLPVTRMQLYFSKLLAGFLFEVCVMLSIVFSFFILILSIANRVSFIESIFMETLKFATSLSAYASAPALVLLWVITILSCILTTINGIIMLFACVTLGQTFTKHRILGSIAVYIIFNIVIQTVASLATFVLMFIPNLFFLAETYTFYFVLFASIISQILLSLLLFFITKRNLERKLNLE